MVEEKNNKVILKMVGKSDLLKKIWEGLKAPLREHGGSLSFIQESEASTPVKERTKLREQVTRLEEARDRAWEQVKQLLAGGKEKELESKLEEIRKETTRLEDAVKELIHNETMGKEVIQETNTDIQKNQTSLEKITTIWTEAKDRLTENERNQQCIKDEEIKRKEKENIAEKLRNMTKMLIDEEKKLEDNRKKIGETQKSIDRLYTEEKGIRQELDNRMQEATENDGIRGEDFQHAEDEDSQRLGSMLRLEDTEHLQDAPPSVGAPREVQLQHKQAPEAERASLEPAGSHEEMEDPGDTSELEDTEHLQDAPPLVGATPGTEGSGTSSPPKLTTSSEGTENQGGETQDQAAEAEFLADTSELEDIALSQDAPPLVGVSPGTEGSSTFTPSKLTTLSEVAIQQQEGPESERAILEPECSEKAGGETPDQPADTDGPADVSEDTTHSQDAPPLVGASPGTEGSIILPPPELTTISKVEQKREEPLAETRNIKPGKLEGLGEGTSGQRTDEQISTGAASLLKSPTLRRRSQRYDDSEEEELEQEGNWNENMDKSSTEDVPKHRRTYCRNTSCVTCKVPCGNCCDCTSASTKSGCRERPQCPDKKPRELRPGKVKGVSLAVT